MSQPRPKDQRINNFFGISPEKERIEDQPLVLWVAATPEGTTGQWFFVGLKTRKTKTNHKISQPQQSLFKDIGSINPSLNHFWKFLNYLKANRDLQNHKFAKLPGEFIFIAK